MTGNYSRPEGKTTAELEAELRSVFYAYPEYSDPDCGGGDFIAMVRKFANDDFYNLHLIAEAYLQETPGAGG